MAEQLDTVDRRVKGQIIAGVARAYLGYIPVDRELDDVCPECGGDGCPTCKNTGEVQHDA